MPHQKQIAVLVVVLLLSVGTVCSWAGDFECDASVVDVSAAGVREGDAAFPADVYIAPRKSLEAGVGSIFKVFRPEEVIEEARQYPLKYYIGRLQIIDVQEEILVGRMIESASRNQYPRVRYETVMIGDCLKIEPPLETGSGQVPPGQATTEKSDTAAIRLSGAERSRVVPFEILFKFDSAFVEDKWSPDLERLARFIKARRPSRVIVEGHTDWIGTDDYNLNLSRRRAQAVVDYLVGRFGLEKELFDIEAYGETKPVMSNETSGGRRKNRRGTISVLFKVVLSEELLPE